MATRVMKEKNMQQKKGVDHFDFLDYWRVLSVVTCRKVVKSCAWTAIQYYNICFVCVGCIVGVDLAVRK